MWLFDSVQFSKIIRPCFSILIESQQVCLSRFLVWLVRDPSSLILTNGCFFHFIGFSLRVIDTYFSSFVTLPSISHFNCLFEAFLSQLCLKQAISICLCFCFVIFLDFAVSNCPILKSWSVIAKIFQRSYCLIFSISLDKVLCYSLLRYSLLSSRLLELILFAF